jgi:hypothetical protein
MDKRLLNEYIQHKVNEAASITSKQKRSLGAIQNWAKKNGFKQFKPKVGKGWTLIWAAETQDGDEIEIASDGREVVVGWLIGDGPSGNDDISYFLKQYAAEFEESRSESEYDVDGDW